MRLISGILFCLSLCISGQVVSQQQYTLEEAISYGLENSRSLKIDFLNIADAEGQVLEYKATGIPKLTGYVDYSYFLDIPTQILPDFIGPAVYGVLFQESVLEPKEVPVGRSAEVKFGKDHNINARLEFTTMLFDGAFFQGLRAQRLYKEFTAKQVDVTAYEIKAGITRAYLAVLIADRNRDLLDNNINNLKKILDETRAIYENGFAEKLDVERLELSLSNLLIEQEKTARLIDVSTNYLKFQMGFPLEEGIQLTDDFDALTNSVLTQKVDLFEPIDFQKRPEYKVLELSEELNSVNMKVIKSGYIPTLNGFATYSKVLQRDDLFNSNDSPWFPSTVVGLNLTVPIFDGLDKKARLQRAKVGLEKSYLQKDEFERSMSMEVRNSRIEYQNARQTVDARKSTLDLAQRIYDTTQIKYREGVGSSVELSQAEGDLYEAQNNYINGLYELIVAKTDLEIALGKN
jgi:outer membrane protein TolC